MKISQGRFDYSLPFNSYKYIKDKLEYDAENCSEKNGKLRDKILILDLNNITSNELRELFKDMDKELTCLNHKVLRHITQLEARKRAINVSIM